MSNERIYVGKAKLKTFNEGGEITKIWITPDGLEEVNNHRKANGGINLIVAEMRQPDRAGNTHTVYIDDWEPSGGGQRAAGRPAQAARRNGRSDGGFGAAPPPSRFSREDEPPVDFSEDEIPF